MENLFMDLENCRPFAKIAFEGFAGDGKSYTAVELAIGIHKLIGSTKPIAIVDTEKAMDKLKSRFDEAGIKAKVTNGRSLATVSAAIQACNGGFADVLIIDSITHIWESFLEAYKGEKNKTRLDFADWGIIKPKWKKEFSDAFVMANTHIIFCGRAGFEYEDEKNAETGKREIFKSGIKMKAEGETAFEPDILVLMEKTQDILSNKKEIYRTATIIKDRTTKIDGKTFKNPSFDDFYPAISSLLDGTLKDIHGDEIPDTFHDFDNKFSEMGRKRGQAIAEIEAAFNLMGLGTGKDEKKIKPAILNKVFKVLSVEKLDSIPVKVVEQGAITIKQVAVQYALYLENCLRDGINPELQKIPELLDEKIKAITETPAV
jgi:hypothetical protein